MPVVAEQGLDRFSLEEIADRADVTRNLLYHYFPRGRRDIVIACGERAGHEITGGWVTDERIPLEQRMAANFVHLAGHANQPTDAWRIFRRARAADDPEYNRIIERFQDVLISTVSLNQLGTTNPPLTVQVALKAFLAFTERALDEMRTTKAPTDAVLQVVAQTLIATLEAASAVSDEPDAQTL